MFDLLVLPTHIRSHFLITPFILGSSFGGLQVEVKIESKTKKYGNIIASMIAYLQTNMNVFISPLMNTEPKNSITLFYHSDVSLIVFS